MNFFLHNFMIIFSSRIVQEFRHLEQFMRFVLNGSCKIFTVKAFVGICTQIQLHLNALFCSHHVSVTIFNPSGGKIS